MQNLKSQPTRACCAPLPRELNNYYNRNHSKGNAKSDCKGSCYCNSPNCDCLHKGINGRLAANTTDCNCCKQLTVEEDRGNYKKTCPKCKRYKRQRTSSPNSPNNNNMCRCCSPQRFASEQKYSNACRFAVNCANQCCKPYEEGDCLVKLNKGVQEDFLRVSRQTAANFFAKECKKNGRLCCGENNPQNYYKEQQQKNIICTCGLLKPTEGLLRCQNESAKVAAPPCRRCGQKVYAAEKLIASGGAFHTSCFSCYGCHKALEVTNLYESQGEIFCKQCYAKYFGMSGYGYGTTLLSPQ